MPYQDDPWYPEEATYKMGNREEALRAGSDPKFADLDRALMEDWERERGSYENVLAQDSVAQSMQGQALAQAGQQQIGGMSAGGAAAMGGLYGTSAQSGQAIGALGQARVGEDVGKLQGMQELARRRNQYFMGGQELEARDLASQIGSTMDWERGYGAERSRVGQEKDASSRRAIGGFMEGMGGMINFSDERLKSEVEKAPVTEEEAAAQKKQEAAVNIGANALGGMGQAIADSGGRVAPRALSARIHAPEGELGYLKRMRLSGVESKTDIEKVEDPETPAVSEDALTETVEGGITQDDQEVLASMISTDDRMMRAIRSGEMTYKEGAYWKAYQARQEGNYAQAERMAKIAGKMPTSGGKEMGGAAQKLEADWLGRQEQGAALGMGGMRPVYNQYGDLVAIEAGKGTGIREEDWSDEGSKVKQSDPMGPAFAPRRRTKLTGHHVRGMGQGTGGAADAPVDEEADYGEFPTPEGMFKSGVRGEIRSSPKVSENKTWKLLGDIPWNKRLGEEAGMAHYYGSRPQSKRITGRTDDYGMPMSIGQSASKSVPNWEAREKERNAAPLLGIKAGSYREDQKLRKPDNEYGYAAKSDEELLDELGSVNEYKYKYNAKADKVLGKKVSGKQKTGVMAQEVQKMNPELVGEHKGYQTVKEDEGLGKALAASGAASRVAQRVKEKMDYLDRLLSGFGG